MKKLFAMFEVPGPEETYYCQCRSKWESISLISNAANGNFKRECMLYGVFPKDVIE